MEKPDREYVKDDISVLWFPNRCIHCESCTDGLPQVFNVSNRPWVDVSKATKEQIIEQVNKCPSKALEICNLTTKT